MSSQLVLSSLWIGGGNKAGQGFAGHGYSSLCHKVSSFDSNECADPDSSPHFRKITEGDVDEVWLQYLLGINKQMRFVKSNQNKPIKAFRNMGPELEKLRLKAASTIRDFFISRIHSLCVPNTNIQIMQQSVFLKYKELHMFVMERHQDVAAEIRQTYINSLRWYFHNHFDRYAKGLAKLQVMK